MPGCWGVHPLGAGSEQHPPAPAAGETPNQPGRKGTFERSQDRRRAPLHTQTVPSEQCPCRGAEPQACSSWQYSGRSQQRVRISPCCSAPPWGSRVVLGTVGTCTAGSRPLREEAAVCFPKRCQVQRVPVFGEGHPSPSASIHSSRLAMPEHGGSPGNDIPRGGTKGAMGGSSGGCREAGTGCAGIPAWAPWRPSEDTQSPQGAPGPVAPVVGLGWHLPFPAGHFPEAPACWGCCLCKQLARCSLSASTRR